MDLILSILPKDDICFETHKTFIVLGLYLDTLIVGHTFCSMLSILNELTLQKKLHLMTNNVFWTGSKNTTTQQKDNIKPLPGPGIEPRTSRTAVRCTKRQLNLLQRMCVTREFT